MIGTALFAYYLNVPPENLPAKADQIFPYFIVHELPTGMAGLVIAGVLAAGMSTMSSSLNSAATVFTIDFYKRVLKPKSDDHAQLQAIRYSTAIIGLLSTVASLAMINAKTALDVWWEMSAIFGGGMLGLFLSAILMPKLKSGQALTATILGLLFVSWASGSKLLFENGNWGFSLNTMMIGVIGTLVIIGTSYILQLIKKN
jgi:SSS family solute:Na+ symporter